MHIKRNIDTKIVTILVGLVVLSGCVLSNMGSNSDNEAYADTDHTATASVTVSSVCSMTAKVTSAHTDTIEPGRYKGDGIGFTTITTFCNDNGGYAIYAIGFSGDKYGNTDMIGTGLDASYNIKTGTATSGGTSNWAMKITPVDGTYKPTVANGFGNFSAVPSEYTKIASFNGVTDAQSATGVGSSITTTYAAYISPAQVAGTYTGQVKYTMVHPSGAAAPEIPCDGTKFAGICITSMQDFGNLDATKLATVKNAMTEGRGYQLKDSRDGKLYSVAKLKDGNIWMTQNLNLAGGTALTSADTDMLDGYTMPTSNGFQSGNKLPASSTSGFSSDTMAYVYNSGNEAADATCNSTTPCHSYYSWTAATLGSGLNISTDNTDAPHSICPKGWKLPTSRTTSASNWQTTSDFYRLAHQYGLDSASSTSESDNGFYTQAGPGTVPNFQLGGYYGSSSFSGGGSSGYYWSATSFSSATDARNLGFSSSRVLSAGNYGRRGGFSVRCLAR